MSPEYIRFPKNPEKKSILDHEVFKYISAETMDKCIKNLSDRNNLRDYDDVLVNFWGGWQLFNDLRILQNYPRWPSNCEIHHGGVITKPVDSNLWNRKVLVIDDSTESGVTLQEIFRHIGTGSKAVVAIGIKGIRKQITDPRIDSAIIVDDINVAGKGKDAHLPGERQLFRQLRELVVIP